MEIKSNHVFLMPPGKEMTINDGRFDLQTTQAARRGWPITISIFLFSLAESYRNRAVVVILSGMDHDGSAALSAIKGTGGVTFAQSNPAVDSMPRHAVETGHMDFLLPPAEIAIALLWLARVI